MCTISTDKLIKYFDACNNNFINIDIKITNLENIINNRTKLIDQLETEIYKLKQLKQ